VLDEEFYRDHEEKRRKYEVVNYHDELERSSITRKEPSPGVPLHGTRENGRVENVDHSMQLFLSF
jgi:hypothetical protein